MDDTELLQRIQKLVNEEHHLTQQGEEEGGLSGDEHERVKALEVQLDQCWDLLRQRRARRSAGLNPEEAKVRGESTVEHFLQ